jgi:hypothetical protein
MKKILIALAVFFVVLIGAAFTLPYFFKDDIVAAVKEAANENLNAKLDFKDVDLSVLRHFPKLSVGLQGLDISGVGPFDGVKLVRCERMDVAVNLLSAISGGQVVVEGIYLEKPDINVYVLGDGRANYDITKPEEEKPAAAETKSAPIRLEHYAIQDGRVRYDDRSLNMLVEMEGLQHEGSGDLYADLYDMVLKTSVEKLSVNYEGMQYLSNAHADWKVTLGADTKNMKFTLQDNNLKINDLSLDLNGWVALPNEEDVVMDLTFGTPQNTFKSFLSIIPGAYTKDFADVQANGSVQFGGMAKGVYNEKTYPAFKLDCKISNGDFKYPALPLGVSDIQADASVNSPGNRLNDMTVNIPAFRLRIGSNPLEGYFRLKTPESDPTVDTKIKGTLHFGELTKAFPVEGVQELSGILKMDMVAKAAMSQVDNQQYDQVDMHGDFALTDFNYRGEGMPLVRINTLQGTLSPQMADIRQFDARLGKSDLRATGRIDNILAYFSTNKTMKGSVTMRSSYFDANEWMTPEPPPEAGKVPSETAATTPAEEKVFDRWDFNLDGQIGRLKYDVYDISDMAMQGHFTPNKMNVNNFALKLGQSDLNGDGTIINAWNYLFDNQNMSGTVNLRSDYFDLNPFMTEETAAANAGKGAAPPPPAEIIPVPENMDMLLNADFNKVQYTNITLQNLDGQIVVKDRAAVIKDCTADVLGGKVAISGQYNTRDLAKPLFNIDLAMQDMGFREAYQGFVTAKTLAPIMQFMDGKFNTTFSMNGVLGKDMTPDFSTLTAAGFLETISAVLSDFNVTKQIGDRLNVDFLRKMDLGKTKNWIEIKNGFVEVKPFDVKVRDINFKIGGKSGLTTDMEYQILTKVPRKTLEKTGIGSAANAGMNWVAKEAAKTGVNIAQGEFVNMRFDVTGTMLNPKIAVKVLGTDGQSTIQEEVGSTVQATVDKAKDSLGNVASRELDKVKEKANAAAEKAADSLRNVANRKAQELKDKAAETAKNKVGEVLGGEAGQKAAEKVNEKVGEEAGKVLGEEGQKTIDDVKNKLNTWDPFKKKKKN